MSEKDGDVGAPRQPMELLGDDAQHTVSRLLGRMRHSAFQGRKLGEAFEIWQRMIDGDGLICLGLAGSLASAGLGPLVAWLVERGYVDVIASTSANISEDLLEPRGARFFQVEPELVDDAKLWELGFYRFYDHVVSADVYDQTEYFMGEFFTALAKDWTQPTITGARFMHEFGRWLNAAGLAGTIAATCFRQRVPLFVPAAPDGPLSEGYRVAALKGPVVDFFADYELALQIMGRYMPPGPGTSAIFLGGGVPKDFLQITATSVKAIRGNDAASPHLAAIQITTDNAVYGGLGGASVASECISWGKEAVDGANVMLFADVTLALPLLCQGLLERYGPTHTRRARAAIHADLAAMFEG